MKACFEGKQLQVQIAERGVKSLKYTKILDNSGGKRQFVSLLPICNQVPRPGYISEVLNGGGV